MFELTVQMEFAAAHRLREYEGACENLHGHNYKLDVALCGERLNDLGILIDFKEVKATLAEIIGRLDHVFLNETAPFDAINPTAENIAKHICEELAARMPEAVAVKSITVWESDRCGATYIP
jgi:6-pyruvoyltetrahydropterin/6-carboxytetrahydropterin synthase